MVKIIDGNLLDFPNDIGFIAHSCNTQNVMGAGIARQIKDRYPKAYEADCYAKNDKDNVLGNYSFSIVDSIINKGIYNMYTQSKIGDKRSVNYEAFYVALTRVANNIEWQIAHDDTKPNFGLPWMISCGLAGGSWNVIFSMINDILIDRKFKTYIVKYHD